MITPPRLGSDSSPVIRIGIRQNGRICDSACSCDRFSHAMTCPDLFLASAFYVQLRRLGITPQGAITIIFEPRDDASV